jgi:hypothetical protein
MDFLTYFQKKSNISLYKNPSSGSHADGQTDRHDEAIIRVSQFFKIA